MTSPGWARTKVVIAGRAVPVPLLAGSLFFVLFIALNGWVPLFPSPSQNEVGQGTTPDATAIDEVYAPKPSVLDEMEHVATGTDTSADPQTETEPEVDSEPESESEPPTSPQHGDKTLYGLSRTSSPFLVRPDEYVAPPDGILRLPQMYEMPEPLKPKKEGMRIPNAVHYVYGLKAPKEGEQGPELPYYAYLAMRSALINLKPEKMYFHYEYKPHGPWWDLIEPHLTLIKTKAPDEIFGRKINHFAHKADVLRLFAIKGMGGIYLDIDVFVIRSFDDLLYYPTTMGMEAHPDDDRRYTLNVEGLCNAVIVSEPNSPFIDRWIQRYVNFDDNEWAEHSVRLPWKLARLHPEEVQVLNPTAFFSPLWKPEEVALVHEKDEYDYHGTGQYAYHAWESMAMDYLRDLTPWSIRDKDTSFHRLVRPFIGQTDDEVYREWKKE